MVIAIAIVCILAVVGLYLIGTAQRLDRLHARVDVAGAAFDAQLRRRCTAATNFVSAMRLDASLAETLRDAAATAQSVSGLGHDREVAEHRVTRALELLATKEPATTRTIHRLGMSGTSKTLMQASAAATELHDEALRASIARGFYNDTVRDALVVRDRRIVRWLGLAGHAPHPAYFEMDSDELWFARNSVAVGPSLET